MRAPISLVLDDDAQLSASALTRLLQDLTDADMVTALPYYQDSATLPGRLLSQFVNNNAALTYLGWLLFAAPLTINGMCYAARTEQLRAWGGFAALLQQLTDDLAIATLVRERGGRLRQSVAPVAMRTAMPDLASYARQMHRWMLFALILLRRQSVGVRSAIGVLQGCRRCCCWPCWPVPACRRAGRRWPGCWAPCCCVRCCCAWCNGG